MFFLRAKRLPASVLCLTALVWLVAVSLCSNRLVDETSAQDHQHAAHTHHNHASSSDHQHEKDSCGCDTIHSFPALDLHSNLAKASVPSLGGPLFISARSDVFSLTPVDHPSQSQSTGPPERLSFAELVLQRSLLSQAPPTAV